MEEYTLDTDNKQQAMVYKGYEGDKMNILRLILLEPGTYPTHPTMGVGLVSKYRFKNNEDINNTLAPAIEKQIGDYLPHIIDPQVVVKTVKENNSWSIYIKVTVNHQYQIVYVVDEDTRTLTSIK